MKNFLRLFGIIALVAAIGFSVIACDNNTTSSANSALNGTWVERGGTDKITLNNGSFSMYDGNQEVIRGTYTTEGSNINGVLTQFRGSFLIANSWNNMGLTATQWYSQSQLRAHLIQNYLSNNPGATQAQAEAAYNQLASSSVNSMYSSFTGTYTATSLTITIFGGTGTFDKQ